MKYRLLSILCAVLLLLTGCAALADATPPTPEDLGKLEFVMTSETYPDFKLTFTYSAFENGQYQLDGLQPGIYKVEELNHVTLLDDNGYEYDSVRSSPVATFEVKLDQTVNVTLFNAYAEKTPVIPPIGETVSIPVTKAWSDAHNADGLRPNAIRVHLYANGKEVDAATVTSAMDWRYTFAHVPKYDENHKQIRYTISEDPVRGYTAAINGYHIVNTLVTTPEEDPTLTEATVCKLWDDDNNAAGLRPAALRMTLSNGMTVTLCEANGWTATIRNLPLIVNGAYITYTWTEQTVLGYESVSKVTYGTTTVFTNKLHTRTPPPEVPVTPPKHGEAVTTVEHVPLGVDVVINHVGDCFD